MHFEVLISLSWVIYILGSLLPRKCEKSPQSIYPVVILRCPLTYPCSLFQSHHSSDSYTPWPLEIFYYLQGLNESYFSVQANTNFPYLWNFNLSGIPRIKKKKQGTDFHYFYNLTFPLLVSQLSLKLDHFRSDLTAADSFQTCGSLSKNQSSSLLSGGKESICRFANLYTYRSTYIYLSIFCLSVCLSVSLLLSWQSHGKIRDLVKRVS